MVLEREVERELGKFSKYVSEEQASMPFLGWSYRALSESSPWHFGDAFLIILLNFFR